MEIKLLSEDYKRNDTLYEDFLNDSLNMSADYMSEKSVFIDTVPDFPVYIAKGTNELKRSQFHEAILILKNNYIQTDRDMHLNELFWHSLLVTKKREYLLDNYPQIKKSKTEFNKIVLKKFDWENYIYKCVLAAEYINDFKMSKEEESKYMDLIYDNLDVYNYTIKYSIFRNAQFIINLLTVIDQENLSEIFKAKIKDKPDLGKDERYGRRVIFELNKNYPAIMAPVLSVNELKSEVLSALNIYTKRP